jgi:type I restriction-modification system DNA methylase subunit
VETEAAPYIEIIEGLHDLPGGYGIYDFSAIDTDVLGTIYEQYLGYVAQDPEAKQLVTKWSKRKKQGIYYTPQYIVKYIVQNTLGKMLEEGGLELALKIKAHG